MFFHEKAFSIPVLTEEQRLSTNLSDRRATLVTDKPNHVFVTKTFSLQGIKIRFFFRQNCIALYTLFSWPAAQYSPETNCL